MLFVDDEPNVLQGFRRMFHNMRAKWKIDCANSAEEALSLLAASRFDVVISDIRMPGMDGGALLSEVATRYPHIIRIVLSGQADEESILRCAGKTHVFLTKPCEPEILKAALVRVCSLTDLLSQEGLKQVVSKMETLPSIPQSYTYLVHELRSEDPSIRRVADIVSKDVSMVARILHLANSAYFMGRQTFTDPVDAILRLGLSSIEGMVLYTNVFSQFNTRLAKLFNIDEIMDHSVRVGAFARALSQAESLPPDVAECCFTAGLMHDVGKLAIAANIPDEYGKALALAKQDGICLWKAEETVLGTTHDALGAYLMRLWGISDQIAEVIAFHDCPSNASNPELGALTVVHAANALEYEISGRSAEGSPPIVDMKYLTNLGLADRVPSWHGTCAQLAHERHRND
jgi:HD-like signal output (HDOD) protein